MVAGSVSDQGAPADAPGSQLVLLETSSNQDYIFGSNRQRENVGASHITAWLGHHDIPHLICSAFEGSVTRHVTTSGKVIATCRDRETAHELIWKATVCARQRYPGIDLTGAAVPCDPATASLTEMGEAVARVHERLASLRGHLPGPAALGPMLPPLRRCASSSRPASGIEQLNGTDEALSDPIRVKRANADQFFPELRGLLGQEVPLARSLDAVEGALEGENRIAVIHADGNGFGQLLLDLPSRIAAAKNLRREDGETDGLLYLRVYKDLSEALERCTRGAFGSAVVATVPLREVWCKTPPILPLVLGGDDLTCLTTGAFALPFTVHFLEAFERLTGREPTIAALNPGGLGMAAGIALVTPHFPFHQAYSLAEELLKNAKSVKKQVKRGAADRPARFSAFDFQVNYASSAVSLDDLRQDWERREAGGRRRVHNRPYVVGCDRDGLEEAQTRWLDRHDWAAMRQRLAPFRRAGAVPNSVAHQLREALFGEPAGADLLLTALANKHPALGKALPGNSLWDSDGCAHTALLLDAMELAELWPATAEEKTGEDTERLPT